MNKPIGSKTDYGYEFYLKRNCSISPAHLAIIFIALGVISIAIGSIFYSLGATLILPFSCLEIFALTAAYFYNAVHANDYERLKIDRNNVYFEAKFGFKHFEEKFLKSLTRVVPSENNNLVKISHGQRTIYFGKNIHAGHRLALQCEIRNQILLATATADEEPH